MKECPTCWHCFDDEISHCPTEGIELKFTQPVSSVIAGRYRLERRLGQGGTAAVYLATQLDTGENVAVKLLHYKDDQSPIVRRRFELEGSMSQSFEHPNIITVIDY